MCAPPPLSRPGASCVLLLLLQTRSIMCGAPPLSKRGAPCVVLQHLLLFSTERGQHHGAGRFGTGRPRREGTRPHRTTANQALPRNYFTLNKLQAATCVVLSLDLCYSILEMDRRAGCPFLSSFKCCTVQSKGVGLSFTVDTVKFPGRLLQIRSLRVCSTCAEETLGCTDIAAGIICTSLFYRNMADWSFNT